MNKNILRNLFKSRELSSRDLVMKALSFSLLLIGLLLLILTFFYLAYESGLLSNSLPDGGRFLFGNNWAPLAKQPQFGIMHAWISTLIIIGISLIISIPISFAIGLFIAEIAPPIFRKVLQPLMEVLVGIPAVVYGFFGYVTLVPWFEFWFDMQTGVSVLTAGIILAVMILPFIASTSAEAFREAYTEYRETVLSMGVSRLYLFFRVIWVRALPGLLAAVSLGLARGLGETLAVLMLSGNTTAVPNSILDRGQPVTALLATELGETVVGSEKYKVLIAAGFFLMLTVILINLGIIYFKKLLHRKIYD